MDGPRQVTTPPSATPSEKYQERAREVVCGAIEALPSEPCATWATRLLLALSHGVAAALARVEAEEREQAAKMADKCGYYGLAAAIRSRGTA